MISNPNLDIPPKASYDLSLLRGDGVVNAPVIHDSSEFLINCYDQHFVQELSKSALRVCADLPSVNLHTITISRIDNRPIQARLYDRVKVSDVPMFEDPVDSIKMTRGCDEYRLFRADVDRENVRDMTTFTLFVDLIARYALSKQIASSKNTQ
ncbi:hypothetical protein A2707_01565 [Candidatus Saccharibacteria bacterium RIFCSPHIGHO2_01_FULL_45_15]|nr:MAG: hypothetical protein A2707_01565 [Candidatus Saccharibacteria bacterium RIFCSPHIGHO2_01_FULL_45_15]OGL27967.1 MAG: hypothetical protein A3C39_02660 [Candidatus Saccharibacteria bacterium RIFCSPHIGHO2_02_FULL_46_12]OGL31727.1 MAG: hypothetical protein A3E76_01280 [Candidatus Saccharibacteria bacterium RIFCSPHIGHO2_12_FULL_44_22]